MDGDLLLPTEAAPPLALTPRQYAGAHGTTTEAAVPRGLRLSKHLDLVASLGLEQVRAGAWGRRESTLTSLLQWHDRWEVD